MDMQNYTLDEVRALIPPGIAAAAKALGDDWCHPRELQMLRGWADSIVEPLTPETDPEGLAANLQIDEGDNYLTHRWYKMIISSVEVSKEAQIESEKDRGALAHLVWKVANTLRRNWEFFEAPKLLLGGIQE